MTTTETENMMNDTLEKLEQLEEAVVLGERALRERNRLLSELNAEGQGKAMLCRRLNAVRESLGAQTLTRGAVYLNIRRYRERTENDQVVPV